MLQELWAAISNIFFIISLPCNVPFMFAQLKLCSLWTQISLQSSQEAAVFPYLPSTSVSLVVGYIYIDISHPSLDICKAIYISSLDRWQIDRQVIEIDR